MQDGEVVVAIFSVFAIFIALPWIVLSALSRKREATVQAAGDPALNASLTAIAAKMERRLDAMEGLLDHEVPGWRQQGSASGSTQRSDR